MCVCVWEGGGGGADQLRGLNGRGAAVAGHLELQRRKVEAAREPVQSIIVIIAIIIAIIIIIIIIIIITARSKLPGSRCRS